MNPLHKLSAMTLCCLALVAPDVQAQGSTPAGAAAYAAGRYDLALTRFERLAAGGDATAAEMAGQLLYYGETVYGPAVGRNHRLASRYLLQAAQAGRPLARYLLDRIMAPAMTPPDDADTYVPGPHGC